MRITDDFHPDPEAERAYALDLQYEDVIAQGKTFRNIAPMDKANTNYELWQAIQRKHIAFVVPVIDFYRLNFGSQESSTFVHSDKFFAEWIAIHYLNRPKQCAGGTSVWKHRETGFIEPPDLVEPWEADRLNEDGKDPQLWQQTGFTPMKFNRLVIFKASLFHSRYPQDLRGLFGDDPETARLCHVFFYNLR